MNTVIVKTALEIVEAVVTLVLPVLFLTDSGLNVTKLLNMTFVALLIPDWDFYKNYTESSLTGSALDLKEALENPDRYTCKLCVAKSKVLSVNFK